MQITEVQAAIGFLISLVTFSGGVIAFWRGSVVKSYAAERDFNHLKNNQLQIGEAIAMLSRDVDENQHKIDVELAQIKTLLTVVIAKTGGEGTGSFRG
jgi:NAD/NADP transhydrogenase beta subunit